MGGVARMLMIAILAVALMATSTVQRKPVHQRRDVPSRMDPRSKLAGPESHMIATVALAKETI
jgi:hypothetical protein